MSGIGDRMDEAEAVNSLENSEAEVSVLCALLDDNRLIDPAADKLRAVDFSVALHGAVFAKMVEQAAAGVAVDTITLAPFFSSESGWTRLMGTLAAAHMNAGSREQTKTYLHQIVDLARRRRMTQGLREVLGLARDLNEPSDTLVALADEAIAELADEGVSIEQRPLGDLAQDVIDSLGKPIVGVQSGVIRSLDRVIGVLRPGELIIGGARPGMGKTTAVSSYALGAAQRGHGVLFFSLEMSADEITRRMLSDICFGNQDGFVSGVLYENVRDGIVSRDDRARLVAAKERFDNMPIEVSDRAGLNLSMLGRRVRRHKRKLAANGKKLELVIIDYLQLMSGSRKDQSPYERISEISQGLKTMAKDEGLAVLALAQLNRGLESRPDKRPIPADLRDSGQIEQDADTIFFLHREEEYLRRSKPADEFDPKFDAWRQDMDRAKGRIEFIVPKRRSGSAGNSMGWFFGEYAACRGDDFYSQGGDNHHG